MNKAKILCCTVVMLSIAGPECSFAQEPDEQIVSESQNRAQKKRDAKEAERESERKYRAGDNSRTGSVKQSAGLPSEGKWRQIEDSTTSSRWRTYVDETTGTKLSFDPKMQEVVHNPATGKYEVVQKEDDQTTGDEEKSSDSSSKTTKSSAKSSQQQERSRLVDTKWGSGIPVDVQFKEDSVKLFARPEYGFRRRFDLGRELPVFQGTWSVSDDQVNLRFDKNWDGDKWVPVEPFTVQGEIERDTLTLTLDGVKYKVPPYPQRAKPLR